MFHEGMSLLERDQAAASLRRKLWCSIFYCVQKLVQKVVTSSLRVNLILFDLPANPDVFRTTYCRLDRIGQENRIQIHVPYLMGTAQERMFRWYNEALNIFSNISPTAQTLQENFIVE